MIQNELSVVLNDIADVYNTKFIKRLIKDFESEVDNLNNYITYLWQDIPNNIQYQYFKNDFKIFKSWIHNLIPKDLDDTTRAIKNKNFELLEFRLNILNDKIDFVEFFNKIDREPFIMFNSDIYILIGGLDKKEIKLNLEVLLNSGYILKQELKTKNKSIIYLLTII